MTTEKTLWVRSMFGYKSQAPMVVITMPGGESIQLDLAAARHHAMLVLEAAEAATGDGFLVGFLADKIGVDQERAALVLDDFRKYREAQER